MPKPDWERTQKIYHEACELPSAQRRAFVEKVCGSDLEIAREVLGLLAFDGGTFLPPPVEMPLTPASDDLLGQTIGERYLVERELGRGGMSRVYLARDQKMHGKAVVIKILSRDLLENPFARQKFEQEVEALARIRHSGVVEVFDRGDWKDQPYFVMQFINGESLRPPIHPNEGMKLDHAASIIKQVGRALEHVHVNGIFHRDLKPENIMLRRGTDKAVLIDFGIAKVIDSTVTETKTHDQSAGTLPYMSPEQLRGESVTAASDIYSMAVVAYEMVTGRRPFKQTTQAKLLEQQRAGVDVKPIVLRRDLSPKAQDLILRGLAFNPSSRPQNARQFGDSLAHALTHRDLNGISNRWLYVSLIILGVAMISFGAYKYWTGNGVAPPIRSFNYFLTVQPMHDGQPHKTAIRSHGENEIFDNGDKFQLTVSTPFSGYLYIFREGPSESNGTTFRMVFPRQSINNGSPSLGADQSIESEWFTFNGPAGAENFWFVWSTSPVVELDSAVREALKQNGGLSGPTLVAVKQYLTSKKAETIFNHNSNQTAVVRARRDLLVALAQFKHR